MSLLRLILAGLMLLATLQGGYFFLARCRLPLLPWLMINACAVAHLTFLIGVAGRLLSGSSLVMYAAVLPLFFFGGGGLVVFPWRGPNLIAQASHLIMMANLSLLVADLLRRGDWRDAALGLLLGIFLFVPFIAYQQHWVSRHPERVQSVLGFRPGQAPETGY